MALGFFRNQQKLVIVIMVLLMIAFLIPSTLSMIGQGRSSGNPVIGTTRHGDLHHQDLRQAALELQILTERVQIQGLASPQNPPAWQLAGFAMGSLAQKDNRPKLCYALLLQEARAAGVKVSDAEVDLFLNDMRIRGEQYESFIGEMRDQTGMGEDDIRAVFAHWLMVHKHFVASLPPTAPSLTELRRQYQIMNEQVKVRVYSLSAEKYLPKVGVPSAQEIQTHWKRFRGAPPESYPTPQSFGFGYLQPKQYIIDYLFIDAEVLSRVVRVKDADIRAYYNENPDEFTKVVQVGSEDPNAQPELKTRQLSLAEAWDQVVRKVRPTLARGMLDPLAVTVSGLLREYRSLPEAQKTTPAYDWVRSRMTASADALLERPVTVNIQGQTISRAIQTLADAANLAGICYPWGEHGRLTLDPDITVTLKANEMTLGEALRRVTAQIPDWPGMQWARCTQINDVLFPVSGVDLFPIRVKRVELPGEELRDHKILGQASTAPRQGRSLIQMLIEMERMRQKNAGEKVVLKQGPEMFVFEQAGPMGSPRVIGKVFWSLENIRPAQAPETRTPEMTNEIVRSIRLRKAYEMAMADANGIDSDEELTAFVRKHELDAGTTDLFSRSQAMGRAGMMFWMQLPLDLPAESFRQAFMDRAFGLIPPPTQSEKRPISVMGIPGTQTVAVLKLVDFRYPGEELFPEWRRQNAPQMAFRRKLGLAQAWFNFEGMVVPRVQWKQTEDEKSE